MKKLLFILIILLIPITCFASDDIRVSISTKKGLYVRSSASTKSSIVGGLVYEKEVSVSPNTYEGYGCSDGFYKITSGAYKNNYICSSYTKIINSADEDMEEEFSEKIISVNTPLNLREKPNKNSNKLTTLAKNKNYVATERVYDNNSGCKNNIWYKIQVNEHSGYVCSYYVRDGASTDNYVYSCDENVSESKAYELGVSTDETFVEVDTTEQLLTFYIDGVCRLKASTVTGKENKDKEAIETIPGNFRITEMVRNKFFKSSNVYSNYWMRFNLGMGLHDADNWRSKFGYKASHGCVNLPLSASKFIYDNVSVGTKVIVHK